MKKSRSIAFWTSCCATLLLIASAVCLADESESKSAPAKDDTYSLMKVFVDTFDQVERNYVKDVNRRELMQAAIEGMMSKLDPYSSYISPEEKARFSEAVEQEFGGVGMIVALDDQDRLVVTSPLPGTPAYRAGVLAGDLITEIEGKSTEAFHSTEPAIRLLKGKPGVAVKIGVRHRGTNKTEQITLVRDIIHVPTVLGDHYKPDGSWDFMLDKQSKIGYVRLTHFSRLSARELDTAINELLAQGMKGLVLDLRMDPGGLLSQAVEICDMFIDSGTIVSTRGRNTPEHTWPAKKDGTFPNFPMAILVNHFSASASEIVAACLQDHHRAIVVGERTWGKGSVQNVIDLEGGSSALKLTTASFHRPSGKNIHRFPRATEKDDWGVQPDPGYLVVMSRPETQEYGYYRRERDVLSKSGPPKSDFKDRQLEKALEAVRSKLSPGSSPVNPPKSEEKAKANTIPPKKAANRGRPGQLQFGIASAGIG